MPINLQIPRLAAAMETALIEAVYVGEAAELAAGTKLLDISIDLSAAFAQNCPPVSYYRIVLRETLRFRKLLVKPGENCLPGMTVGLFEALEPAGPNGPQPTGPNGPQLARPNGPRPAGSNGARAVRIMTAGIVYHPAMWSGRIM